MYKIHILPQNIICYAEKGENLLRVLSQHDPHFFAPCGGKGICGKCKIKLIDGEVDGTTKDADSFILSCLASVQSDLTIEKQTISGDGLADFTMPELKSNREGLGVILDIGTTTLASCLIDLKSGKILSKFSCLNPQGIYGADVLSRIQACQEGKLVDLQNLIIKETQSILTKLSPDARIEELIVGANTTMLHLFLGVDPTPIGVFPFTPVFLEEKIRKGEELGLSAKQVRLLPSAAAYIGSDVTAGVLACNMHLHKETELFVDIGTNGEVVLAHKGKLYATSTAAGPALEGACIECGIGGVLGAIDRVSSQDGKLLLHTIGNEKPIGICGSGLIDLIALLWREKLIDENGTWDEECSSTLVQYRKEDRFYLTEDIYLSQRDIRQFQLAKAAIAAGIKTLLSACGVSEETVKNTYLAGGLGYYMNLNHALETGLLPLGLKNSLQSVGNTCLSGTRLCLLSMAAQREIVQLAGKMEIVDLSCSPIFQDEYMNRMGFED